MLEVLETAKYIADKSRLVWIDKKALTRFARKLLEDEIKVPPWDPLYHFCDGTEETVSYLLVLDSLNFCFWPPLLAPTRKGQMGNRIRIRKSFRLLCHGSLSKKCF